MKFLNNISFFFRLSILAEGCLVFSFLSAFLAYRAFGVKPDEYVKLDYPQRIYLKQNTQILKDLLDSNLPPALMTAPAEGSGDVGRNFQLVRAIEESFARIPNVAVDLDAILSLQPIHPYFAQKRKRFLLERMLREKRYREFLRFYDNPREDIELQMERIDALMKTGNEKDASVRFRETMEQNPRIQTLRTLPAEEWRKLIQQLDEGFWFQRFLALVKRDDFAELNVEIPMAGRFPQLVNLFRAHYLYEKKQYSQARTLLSRITSNAYRPYGENLRMRMDLRQNDSAENVEARIESFRDHAGLYSDTLFSVANLLLVSRQYYRAYSLFDKYVQCGSKDEENYWRAIWLMAWMQQRLDNRDQAERWFKTGSESPYFAYRVASLFWLARLSKNPDIRLPRYPLSYYSMKTYGDTLFTKDSADTWIEGLNAPPSALFMLTYQMVLALVRSGDLDNALELLDWTLQERELAKIDRRMLAIVKAIIFHKQSAFRQTYLTYKNILAMDIQGNLPLFLSRIFYPVSFQDLVTRYSREYRIEPALVMAIIREESFFNSDAVSSARAMGVMQLLLGTAKQMAAEKRLRINKTDLFNPEINIRLGIHYFSVMLAKYDGKVYLALAAYNAGDNRVDQWVQEFGDVSEEEFIEMIPFSQTRNYVKNILLNRFLYSHFHENI